MRGKSEMKGMTGERERVGTCVGTRRELWSRGRSAHESSVCFSVRVKIGMVDVKVRARARYGDIKVRKMAGSGC